MKKGFIQQHVKQAFNHLNTTSDRSLNPTIVESSPIITTNPSSMVQEIVRIQHKKALQEQNLLRQQQEELERRQQAKLLQAQQLVKQQEELAALKVKLEHEKSILLQEQQLKQQQLLYEEQLKQEKERTLERDVNLKTEQQKFEKQKEEMILQSQELQNQINVLKEAPVPIITPTPITYMFLTEDTPENEYNIAHPPPATPSPEPTGIDPEYIEVGEEENLEYVPEQEIETDVALGGNIEDNTESDYEIL